MHKLHQKNRGSITLGMVFGLGMLGLGIGATTLVFSTNTLINNNNAASGMRTLVTADAATREGVYRVLNEVSGTTMNFTSSVLPILNGESSNAYVGVTGTWPVFEVRGTAINHRTTRKVVADIDLFPSAFAFEQAVYTNGLLDLNGNVTVNGTVYATTGVELGGSAEITEDAFTPEDIETSGSASVVGESVDNHPTILPPEINLTPYQNQANLNGTFFDAPSGGPNASAVIKNNTVSGIYFINDDLDINGNGTDFTGALVVMGNLTLTGGEYTSDASNPLVLYIGGNLNIAGNITINGIVYVAGETTFGNGTPTINGALISVNSANKAAGGGNISINYDPTYAEAWQNIVGLDTESGSDPQIQDWHEE